LKLRNFLRAGLLVATFAYAQSASADECNDKTATLDIVACMEKQTASWDAVVEFQYENTLRSASGEALKAQKQAQELWLRYREANCRAAGMGEGTITAVNAAECRLRMTKVRAAELGAADERSKSTPASTVPMKREEGDGNSGRRRADPPDGADPIPAQKIREVYTLLAADKLDNEHNPIMNPRLAKSFFARAFLDLWAKDQKCWEGEGTEGAAQMWVGGQDYKISDVRVTVPMATADYERVLASVMSFGIEQHWAYEFRRSENRWLVHDVLLEGRSLSNAMRGGCSK
jgi:uncharacterized protein YecT (DUF1311 family)